LDDPAVVRDGARAYSELGCVNCHGAPGVNWAKFSEGLRPDPPDLKDVAKELEPAEIFWVIKKRHQHDWNAELWSHQDRRQQNVGHCSFRKEAPDRAPDDYKAWAEGHAGEPPSK
jgi:hypothetical protein